MLKVVDEECTKRLNGAAWLATQGTPNGGNTMGHAVMMETPSVAASTEQQQERKTLGYEDLLIEYDLPLVTITMNRPERRNALSVSMMEELIDALRRIGQDPEVHAIILAGAGPVFSAGHDLRELATHDMAAYRHLFDVCTELMMTLRAIPQPVIARVHQLATAAGCQLVAACDLVVASEEATFAVPGMKIGLCCSTPMVSLMRVIGRKRAFEMLVTARSVSAREAADWGLVNRVVPADQLESATRELALAISAASTCTVAMGKQAFYTEADMDDPKAYAYAKELMTMSAMTRDAQEGVSAFLEKRTPHWTGR